MAGQRNGADEQAVAMRAAVLVTEAMDLLDAHGMVPELTAHLAIAQQGLRNFMTKRRADPAS